MTVANEILTDSFERVRESVHQVVEGLDADALAYQPDAGSNSIAWLVWHLARVQDDHIADVAGAEQVWTTGGWAERFDLPYERSAIGYGHSSDEVEVFRADPELLAGYYDAVHSATVDAVATLQEEDFARVVDTRWDPPVTLAVRLVSVVDDDAQHIGQAAYVRGILPDA
ncbi:MAG: mycothiol transferase [Nocardioidaceae bacterium]